MLVTRIEAPKPPEEKKVDHFPVALVARRVRAGVLEPEVPDRISTKIPYGWTKGRFDLHMTVVRNHFKVGRLCTFSSYIAVPGRLPRLYEVIQINDHFESVSWDFSRGVPNCIKIRTIGGSVYDMDMPQTGLRLLTEEETKLADLQNQPAQGNA